MQEGKDYQNFSPWDARLPCYCPNTHLPWVPVQHLPEPSSFPILRLAGPSVGAGVGGAATECHLAVPALGKDGKVGARRVPQHLPSSPHPTQQDAVAHREAEILQAESPRGEAETLLCSPALCRDVSPGTGDPREQGTL